MKPVQGESGNVLKFAWVIFHTEVNMTWNVIFRWTNPHSCTRRHYKQLACPEGNLTCRLLNEHNNYKRPFSFSNAQDRFAEREAVSHIIGVRSYDQCHDQYPVWPKGHTFEKALIKWKELYLHLHIHTKIQISDLTVKAEGCSTTLWNVYNECSSDIKIYSTHVKLNYNQYLEYIKLRYPMSKSE